MKLYFGTPGWGWTMWGIGYRSTWFFGFSKKREKTDIMKYQFSDEADE